jgi:hypothetical protein
MAKNTEETANSQIFFASVKRKLLKIYFTIRASGYGHCPYLGFLACGYAGFCDTAVSGRTDLLHRKILKIRRYGYNGEVSI